MGQGQLPKQIGTSLDTFAVTKNGNFTGDEFMDFFNLDHSIPSQITRVGMRCLDDDLTNVTLSVSVKNLADGKTTLMWTASVNGEYSWFEKPLNFGPGQYISFATDILNTGNPPGAVIEIVAAVPQK